MDTSLLQQDDPQSVVMQGRFDDGIYLTELTNLLSHLLNKTPLHEAVKKLELRQSPGVQEVVKVTSK